MPDKKLTDSEIVSTLQKNIRDSERINSSYALCNLNFLKETVDLITRLQEKNKNKTAEIEELKTEINMFRGYDEEIKAVAYKEFAEKSYIIIDMLLKRYGVKDFEEFKAICQILRSLKNSMNNLLKELVGEDDASKD